MAITAGQDGLASDFINASAGAGDSGKGVKLNSDGVLDHSFMVAPIKETLTAGATINGATLPVPVYMKAADSEVYACDANDTNAVNFFGFAVTNGTDGNDIDVQYAGVVSGFSGLTINAHYYVQDTAGTIGTTPSTTTVIPVGIAKSATELLIVKGRKIASGSTSHSQLGTGNDDNVITIGFRPSTILTIFEINSAVGGPTSSTHPYRGSAMFKGTTLIGAQGTAANNTNTDINSGNIDDYVLFNTLQSIDPVTGADRANATHSINAVSDTGFTSRLAGNQIAGSGTTTSATIKYIAME